MTPERLVAAIAPVVRDYVAAAVARVTAEFRRTVEAIPTGSPGPPGAPGQDGHAGADGHPGADGAGIEDVQVTYDGDRTITLAVALNSGLVKAFPIVLPIALDRGTWDPRRTYTKGDLVTFKGSGWICQHDAAAGGRPNEGGAWRLMIRGVHRDPDRQRVPVP